MSEAEKYLLCAKDAGRRLRRWIASFTPTAVERRKQQGEEVSKTIIAMSQRVKFDFIERKVSGDD